MTKSKPASIQIDPGVPNFLLPYYGNTDKEIIQWYQSAIGSLMLPAIHTRPDIAYSMGVLSWYYSNPGLTHYNLVIQIFRYLFGTFDLGSTFIANSKGELVSYTDFDYARLIDGRKFIGGYILILSDGSLSHQSKLQSIIALSDHMKQNIWQ